MRTLTLILGLAAIGFAAIAAVVGATYAEPARGRLWAEIAIASGVVGLVMVVGAVVMRRKGRAVVHV